MRERENERERDSISVCMGRAGRLGAGRARPRSGRHRRDAAGPLIRSAGPSPRLTLCSIHIQRRPMCCIHMQRHRLSPCLYLTSPQLVAARSAGPSLCAVFMCGAGPCALFICSAGPWAVFIATTGSVLYSYTAQAHRPPASIHICSIHIHGHRPPAFAFRTCDQTRFRRLSPCLAVRRAPL